MAREPEVIRDKVAMRAWSRARRRTGASLALVPTMGFLHDGHLSLVRAACAAADLVVVSIYVNPGQFAPSEDLAGYPSNLPFDLKKLADAGVVHAVFCPPNLYDYGDGEKPEKKIERDGEGGGERGVEVSCAEDSGHESWIRVEKLEKGMCGKNRPVFFRGVATVVAKLFNIVEPDVAVFGKKDYQQWRVVCRMVRAVSSSSSSPSSSSSSSSSFQWAFASSVEILLSKSYSFYTSFTMRHGSFGTQEKKRIEIKWKWDNKLINLMTNISMNDPEP